MTKQLQNSIIDEMKQLVKEGLAIELTARQKEIVALVKKHEPITGDMIAETLGISRPTIRSDMSVLVMLGYLDAKPKVGYFIGSAGSPVFQTALKLKQMMVKEVQGLPIVIRDTATVQDAVVTLFVENVGSIIVIDADDSLIGIISRKDLLKVTIGSSNSALMPASLVMTRQPNIVYVYPDDSVLTAAERMIHHQVDGLPVINPIPLTDGGVRLEVVGRITKTTMTRLLLEWTQENL